MDLCRDEEGFLQNLEDWNEAVAQIVANDHNIELSENHWELIGLVRDFYEAYALSPAMRPLLKYAAIHLPSHKCSSIYFLTLFPGSPAKLLAKIAGLPKPENCL